MTRTGLHETASAAPTAEELRLEVIPIISGHFDTYRHRCPSRILAAEMVLILVIDGHGWYQIAGGPQRPLRAGEALLLPAGPAHAYACDPVAGWDIRWVHFRGSYAESLARLAGFGPERPVIRTGGDPEPITRLARLQAALDPGLRYGQLDAAVELVGLLIALKKCDQGRLGEDARLLAAVESGGGLAQMARGAGLSTFHFLRRFKRATGTTPWRYLLDLRLARAKNRLIDPACSVRDAATAAGFADAAYFSRLFRRRTGMTPSAFRASHCPLPG